MTGCVLGVRDIVKERDKVPVLIEFAFQDCDVMGERQQTNEENVL